MVWIKIEYEVNLHIELDLKMCKVVEIRGVKKELLV
jgi:hypothetical protein